MRACAAVGTAVLGISLASPVLDQAAATNTVPALPDITAALSAAGVSSTNVSSITGELAALEATSPGGSLPLGSLNVLDNSLTTLNGGLVSSLLTPVVTLLAALNPAAPSNVENVLADLQQIGSAPGASTAVQQAVAETSAALSTAGLGQLLSQLSGLSTTSIDSALGALATVQGLAPGAGVPATTLNPVGTVLTALAGQSGVSSADASSLTSAAAILNGTGSLSPASLLTAIGDIQTAAGSLPSALDEVANALATQLSGSGTLFGELASVGNAPSAATVNGAISGLAALPGLTAGAPVPTGSLTPLAGILTTTAGEPGVPSTSATDLNSAAVLLGGSGGISPSSLLAAISDLQGSSGLPSPLADLVTQVTSALAGSGSIFGEVPGLTPAQVTSALNALAALPGLAPGTSVPAGALAPVAAILTQVAAQPGVPPSAATTLDSVAATMSGGAAIDPPTLSGLISQLQSVSGLLPAPLQPAVDQIAGDLSAAGSLASTGTGGTSGTGTGGTSGTGTGGTTGTGTGTTGTGTGTISGTGTGTTGTAGSTGSTSLNPLSHTGYAVIKSVRRHGDRVTLTLLCTASRDRTCRSTIRMTERGHRKLHRAITLRGGARKTFSLQLRKLRKLGKAAKAHRGHRRALIRLSVKTGRRSFLKALR